MWAVYTPDDVCLTSTLSIVERDAKNAVLIPLRDNTSKEAWDELQQQGWSVHKVEVTITPKP